MKKVLSIMLAAMMLVSLFAVNAGAALPSTYEVLEGYVPDTDLIVQDFSDITANADYTDKAYDGAREVREDGILHMYGAYRTGTSSYTYSDTPITASKYVYEFDFMRNDDFTTDMLLSVVFQKEANANSENANLKKYGVVIPVRTVGLVEVDGVKFEDETNPMVDIEPHKWYKFRLEIDEDAFIAAGGTQDNGPLNALMQVYRKAEDEKEWTRLNHNTYNHFISSVCRVYGASINSLGITDKEVIIGVGGDNYGEKNSEITQTVPVIDEETGEAKVDPETGEAVTKTVYLKDDDFRNADFQFDNIKVATPGEKGTWVTKDLPIDKGVVYTQASDAITIEMIGKDVEVTDEEGNVTGTEKVASTTYSKATIGWTYEPTSFVATFDAITNVEGGPLSISFAGKAAGSHIITIAPTEIDKCYSYKVPYTSNGSNVSVKAVYRKAEDEAEWTRLTSGNEYWHGYNSSGSKGEIRWYLYGAEGTAKKSNCEVGTKWTIKNMQVTDSYAMTGVATVADGNLTIDLNTVVADAAAMVAAVYDGDRMVSAQAVDVAAFANDAEIVVPYADSIANPAVKIFVWNGMGTMIPVDVPVDITSAIN